MGNEDSAIPYLNARREWEERYGDHIARARSWRIVAMAAIAVAGIEALALGYIAGQSKIEPFVAVVDKMGSPVLVAQPSKAGNVSQRVIEAQLANWIWTARTVLSDGKAQRALIDKTYAMTGPDAAAYLNSYFTAHPPFGDFTTSVQIASVLPISRSTYQITWDEGKEQAGQPAGVPERWEANITVVIDPSYANRPTVIAANPLGIVIKTISWTQIAKTAS
ncbi:conjugal transfer protein [Burkholderiales bacterium GJ-E10]|nr:conjugal transfer protein [Burkholderiales bacterium GJ-E10]